MVAGEMELWTTKLKGRSLHCVFLLSLIQIPSINPALCYLELLLRGMSESI